MKGGRGAPLKVTPGLMTHKLVLQLELLRLDTGCTWDQLTTFFPKTVCGDPLNGLNLQTEIRATLKGAKTFLGDQPKFSEFLQVDLGLQIKARNTGFSLLKYGVGREHLLQTDRLQTLKSPGEITNAVIVDLSQFKKREREFTVPKLRAVLQFFYANIDAGLSDQQLSKRVEKVSKAYDSLRKSIKKPGGEAKMNLFLEEKPDFTLAQFKMPPTKIFKVIQKLYSFMSF